MFNLEQKQIVSRLFVVLSRREEPITLDQFADLCRTLFPEVREDPTLPDQILDLVSNLKELSKPEPVPAVTVSEPVPVSFNA